MSIKVTGKVNFTGRSKVSLPPPQGPIIQDLTFDTAYEAIDSTISPDKKFLEKFSNTWRTQPMTESFPKVAGTYTFSLLCDVDDANPTASIKNACFGIIYDDGNINKDATLIFTANAMSLYALAGDWYENGVRRQDDANIGVLGDITPGQVWTTTIVINPDLTTGTMTIDNGEGQSASRALYAGFLAGFTSFRFVFAPYNVYASFNLDIPRD